MAAKTPELDFRDNPFRNYLINGDMRVAQRGASFVAVANATYTLDRMQYAKTGAMVHTITQGTDVPTQAQAGYLFQNCIRLNLTTPDTSIAAGDQCQIGQKIEGYNWTSLAQKAFTLSFWVKATLTGTYCVSFRNTALDRSYVAEYTINASNTWEKKTITVSASPSAGTWDYTNGIGLNVFWTIASGTTFQTTANTWQTGNFIATANQVNGVNTGATDLRITGIMINEGREAAEFKLAGDSSSEDFDLCQRYYEGFAWNTNQLVDAVPNAKWNIPIWYKVAKRALPTVSVSPVGSGAYLTSQIVVSSETVNGFMYQSQSTAAGSLYQYSATGTANAEL